MSEDTFTTPNTSVPTAFFFEGENVRVVMRDGDPWFVASDVCRVLAIANTSDALKRLDDDERGVASIYTPSHPQNMVTINESGLYNLVLGSRKAEAKRFKKWITSEVIPSIRKTGGYGTSDPMVALEDPDVLRTLLLKNVERVLALQAENAAMTPKVMAYDRIAFSAEGAANLTDAAKMLQLRPKKLTEYLHREGWIFRRPSGGWVGYETRVKQGLLEHKYTSTTNNEGVEVMRCQVKVTPKGLARLAEEFNQTDLFPH